MATRKLKSKSAKASTAKQEAAFTVKNASKVIMEQAEHIWLAGLGAFSKAQEQGGKVFETLIKEGQALEKATRKVTTGRVESARDAVETTVTQVRERASDTWDRLEKVFEDRVSKALNRLGVPGPADLAELSKRVDELSKAVRALEGGPSTRNKPTAVKTKAAAKPRATAAKKPAAKKPVAKKAAAPRRATKVTPKPAAANTESKS